MGVGRGDAVVNVKNDTGWGATRRSGECRDECVVSATGLSVCVCAFEREC